MYIFVEKKKQFSYISEVSSTNQNKKNSKSFSGVVHMYIFVEKKNNFHTYQKFQAPIRIKKF